MKINNVFRAYDIRGVVGIDFDLNWVERLGKVIGTYFLDQSISSAVVGYDCRKSSVDYNDILVKGLLSTGIDVISIGMVPTPVLYFAVKHLNRYGGVMITASHNPPQYNGFKIWAGESTIYGNEIQKIRNLFEAEKFASGEGVLSFHDIIPSYITAVIACCNILRPVKVIVDGGNGVGGAICADILKGIGVDVTCLYCEPDGDFPHHHPDPVVEENMRDLVNKVKAENADLGIGLDGDADRLGIIDSNGRLLFGDELLSIYAQELLIREPGSTIIGDVKCSNRLFNDIQIHGGNPVMSATGHSIIKARMKELDAPLAGEMSGHMFFADGWYGFDDAIYGAARLVSLFSAQDKPMAELPGWPPSVATREINIPCDDTIKFAIVEKVKDYFKSQYDTIEIDGARINFPYGWGLVRASNTQPVLVTRFEADTEEHLISIRKEIETPLMQWINEANENKK